MLPDTLNVLQVGLGFFFFFVQFNSRGYIQESIFESISQERDIDPHTGYNGLAVYYIVFTVANLVISPVIDRLGIQRSMAIGAAFTIFYEIGFFVINVPYYYSTCVLSGIGAALIWPPMGTYMTLNSTEKTLERNSSIVWALSQASQLVGGIILFIVFVNVGSREAGGHISHTAQLITSIAFTISLFISMGLFFTLRDPTPRTSESCQLTVRSRPPFLEDLSVTIRLMFTKRMGYLAVVFAYTGIVQSFWTSIFPTVISFTGRLGGETNMTYMAISTSFAGIGQLLLCGYICSWGKRNSRTTIVRLGFICHLVVCVGVYLFFPAESSVRKTDEISIFEPNLLSTLVISLLLGFGDGCWNTQVYAFVGDVFPHTSNEAFALFNFYQSMMTSLSLYYSSHIYLSTHLIILAVSSVIACYCYFQVDNMGRMEYSPPSEKLSSESPIPSEKSVDVNSTGPLLPDAGV